MSQDAQPSPNRTGRKLRVLYFIGSYGPDVMGNASHEETVLAMRERGHSVEVFTQITEPGVPFYSGVHISGVRVHRVNLAARRGGREGLTRKASSLLFQYKYLSVLLRAYRRVVANGRYDLVHVEGAYPFGFVAALGSGDTPYITTVQGADVIDLPEADYGYRRYPLPRLAVAFALRRAARIRVISAMLDAYLLTERLARPDRIDTIYRSIEKSAFPPEGASLESFRASAQRSLVAKYNIPTGRPIVMALSRLHPFKGLEYLVDAVKSLIERMDLSGPPAPFFLICGPSRRTEHFGDYGEFLRERAKQEGVGQHIAFTGQVPHTDVRSHLAGATIFVCPSLIEAQNKVVPEAAAVGTPSVVTETTGIASYLAPLNACLTVPPRSAETIANAISLLLEDPAEWERLHRNALEAARTLTAERLAPQLEETWLRAAWRS